MNSDFQNATVLYTEVGIGLEVLGVTGRTVKSNDLSGWRDANIDTFGRGRHFVTGNIAMDGH